MHRYLVALGSNRRHHRHGPPERVLVAAMAELARAGALVEQFSPILRNPPIGPSRRRFANAAAVLTFAHGPGVLLEALKKIERDFGRKRSGRRWGERVLDLDIILWDGGAWKAPGLIIPHPAFRQRAFVLRPAAAIAPGWRDPFTGFTLSQLSRRLTKPRCVPS